MRCDNYAMMLCSIYADSHYVYYQTNFWLCLSRDARRESYVVQRDFRFQNHPISPSLESSGKLQERARELPDCDCDRDLESLFWHLPNAFFGSSKQTFKPNGSRRIRCSCQKNCRSTPEQTVTIDIGINQSKYQVQQIYKCSIYYKERWIPHNDYASQPATAAAWL